MHITRIICGDFIFTSAGLLACLIAFVLTIPAPWSRWKKIAYGLILAFMLAILLHWYVESLQTWWMTPLAPRMKLTY